MESPAHRMRRALVGFGLSLVVAVCIAMLDESNGWTSGFLWVIPTSLFFISFLLILILSGGGDRYHGNWISDSWMSRETEGKMRERLEKERDEANMEGHGSNWAKMEMRHLESKHSEE